MYYVTRSHGNVSFVLRPSKRGKKEVERRMVGISAGTDFTNRSILIIIIKTDNEGHFIFKSLFFHLVCLSVRSIILIRLLAQK